MSKQKLMMRDASGGGDSKVATRLKQLAKETQRREATVASVDVENRTVELSFSSEIEYQRYWGIEVLGHMPGEVRLGRLNDKAALLWNHNWDDQRGVVESARIDADGRGRAVVRLSRSEDGEQLLQDIADGIITKVSVGYQIHGIKLVEERENTDVYRVTDWEPFEISMVSVPADATVGVGRAAEKPQEDGQGVAGEDSASIENSAATRAINKDIQLMKYRYFTDAQGNYCRVAVNDAGQDTGAAEIVANVDGARQAGADSERARVRSISEMGKQYGRADMAMQFIAEGKTAEDFQRALLSDFATQRSNKPLEEQQKDASIGLSDKEVRQFSIMRAVRALVSPQDAAAQRAAAFELEASAAAAKRYGKEPKGIIIPNDVLASRTFSIGTAAGAGTGAGMVDTNVMFGSFIELLRKRAWVMRRARSMGGLVGNVEIPKQNATGQAYWVGEGGNVGEGQPGVGQINFSPKTVGAYTDITRRLMMQSTPDVEAFVRDDLLKIIALEIDRVAIYGSGTENQPKGLKLYNGINGKDFATAGKPTFEELVAMETAIALDDADVDSMSYAFNAAVRGHLKTTPKFGTGTETTIWEPGNTVNGYQTDVSNQIASGDVFFGNWNDLIVAMWGGLELMVDPYANSLNGGVRLIALQDLDINLRRVESFCWGSDLVS